MAENSKQFTNKTINIKLDNANYLKWRQQIGFTIVTHMLEGYLYESTCIDEWACNPDGTKVRNHDFDAYKQQDSALSSWFLSSISPDLLPSLICYPTSHEIWIML